MKEFWTRSCEGYVNGGAQGEFDQDIRTIFHTWMSDGRLLLTAATRLSTPGGEVISFMFTTLPAAWTPASVRAALARETFTGSSALSSDTAPDFTKASKSTPSIVLALGWLGSGMSADRGTGRKSCLHLHPCVVGSRKAYKDSTLLFGQTRYFWAVGMILNLGASTPASPFILFALSTFLRLVRCLWCPRKIRGI